MRPEGSDARELWAVFGVGALLWVGSELTSQTDFFASPLWHSGWVLLPSAAAWAVWRGSSLALVGLVAVLAQVVAVVILGGLLQLPDYGGGPLWGVGLMAVIAQGLVAQLAAAFAMLFRERRRREQWPERQQS